MITQLIVYVS